MSLATLHDLFLHELKDMLYAERQIVKALPKLAKAAESSALQAAFKEHLEETEGQVERLEQVFELVEKSARGKRCAGMEGILEEGAELLHEDAAPAVRDAGLIASAQKVEHYEICAYGSLIAYAQELGLSEAAELLRSNLAEEKAADEKLTELAMEINAAANHAAMSSKH